MLKRFVPILAIFATLLTACGAQATPTMNPADVQGTAVAAAWTMVAATQQSIPTETPLPPTPIPSPTPLPPLPTLTPLALPTDLGGLPTAALPTNLPTGATADPCNAPMAKSPAGKKVFIKIINQNKATANIGLHLNITPFGECGNIGYSIPSKQSITATLPAGCYWASGWVNDPKHPTQTSVRSTFCMHGDDKIDLLVEAELIVVNYP